VIVTGDLTYLGSSEEFNEAIAFLARLLGQLDLSVDNLVVIPGNHDIRWTTEETYKDDALVNNAPAAAKANYKKFYRTFFHHDADERLAMGRRYLLPNGMAVEVCGLNSSSLETGRRFLAGIGRVEEPAFQTAGDELGWTDPATMALRILAIHHHLALTENLELVGDYYRGFGIAIDSPRVQRMAAKHGVQLALHGHEHRAFIWRSSVYELPEHTHMGHQLGHISIVGGGSAGSKETEAGNNYFNVLEVEPGGIGLSIYRAKNRGMFEKMQEWRSAFDIGHDPRRLLLSEWVEYKRVEGA
jgi:3',5'-cyclic AMP phosphodiesterase CpdA